jgi:hypothetical protein
LTATEPSRAAFASVYSRISDRCRKIPSSIIHHLPKLSGDAVIDVVPLDPIRKDRDPHGWWACLCNGIVVRIAAERASLARYATDPGYRLSLVKPKLWEKHAGR